MNDKFIKYIKIAAVVIFIILAIWFLKYRKSGQQNNNLPQSQNSAMTPTSTNSTQAAPESSRSGTKSMPQAKTYNTPTIKEIASNFSYGTVVNSFGANRVQIDEFCRLNPSSMVAKNGTSIMFDNRSAKGEWLYFGSNKFYISSYGFKIINFLSKALPFTVQINCGTGKNNGQIILN